MNNMCVIGNCEVYLGEPGVRGLKPVGVQGTRQQISLGTFHLSCIVLPEVWV